MNEFALRVLTAPLGQTHLFSVGQAGFIIKSKSGQVDRLTAENIMKRKAELNYVGLSFNFKIEE